MALACLSVVGASCTVGSPQVRSSDDVVRSTAPVTSAVASSSEPASSGLPSTDGVGPATSGCDRVASPAVRIADALESMADGGVLCVQGERSGERTVLTRGGSAERPLVLRALGKVSTAGFVVRADHVELRGFRVGTASRAANEDDGAGIVLEGTGLVVRENDVEGAAYMGILCSERGVQCQNAVIADNTVRRASGSGIVVHGRSVVVARNDVSGSIMVGRDDADGLRFFGVGHRIVGNHIHDIRRDALPGLAPADQPHVDCFQTFDIRGFAIEDVVIARNLCVRVDGSCVIATAGNAAGATTPARSRRLVFSDNVCRVGGSQAVYLSGIDDALVAGNLFEAGAVFYGVSSERSTNVRVVNNVFEGDAWPYWSDGEPVVAAGNVTGATTQVRPSPTWSEPLERWGVTTGLAPVPGAPEGCRRSSAGSVLVDRGVAVPSTATVMPTLDVTGSARIADGNGDGVAAIDIGPFEWQGATIVTNTTNTTTTTTTITAAATAATTRADIATLLTASACA